MVVILTGLAPGRGAGLTELGQFCVNLAPFDDTIRLSLTQAAGSATLIDVNFRWRSGTSYQIGGTGVTTDSLLSPGSFDLALTGTHNTSNFGGNQICSLFATLTGPSFSGPWQLTCTGTTTPFTNSGTLNFVSCISTSAAEGLHATVGPGAGQ